MINRVVLVGRITKDLELKHTQSGIANLRFTLAVNRSFKSQDGLQQADFINCVSWRGQAENMAKFLRKGSLIGVEGRIETGNYQAQDGTTRYTTDVIADSVQFLESRSSGDGQQGATSLAEARQRQSQQNSVHNPFDPNFSDPNFNPLPYVKDDDLPF